MKAALEVEEKRKRKDSLMTTLLADPETQEFLVEKIRKLGLENV